MELPQPPVRLAFIGPRLQPSDGQDLQPRVSVCEDFVILFPLFFYPLQGGRGATFLALKGQSIIAQGERSDTLGKNNHTTVLYPERVK